MKNLLKITKNVTSDNSIIGKVENATFSEHEYFQISTGGDGLRFGFLLININNEGLDRSFLRVHYMATIHDYNYQITNLHERMNLDKGRIDFECDTKKFSLKPMEMFNKTEEEVASLLWCHEVFYYEISKENIQAVCDSNSIFIRIIGKKYFDIQMPAFTSNEMSNSDKFKIHFQQFYNNIFDSTKYQDSLNKEVDTNSRDNMFDRKGCLVPIIISMSSFISLLVYLF